MYGQWRGKYRYPQQTLHASYRCEDGVVLGTSSSLFIFGPCLVITNVAALTVRSLEEELIR